MHIGGAYHRSQNLRPAGTLAEVGTKLFSKGKPTATMDSAATLKNLTEMPGSSGTCL